MRLVQVWFKDPREKQFGVELEDGTLVHIGGWADVCAVKDTIADIDKEGAEGNGLRIVPGDDSRLIRWLTIGDAATIAIEQYGWPSTASNGNTIRAAARRENFRTIRDSSGRYRIDRRSFVEWLDQRS